ncbi:DUF2218 domain-containing protein [Novispirillum itersonii]|uniref:DUF2218 domain-containing protein n=1 Tax=Novispirillum itersonii TaxID=189 RepID=UPI0003621DB7|nr:DUF2218 domain-containing protein [Novispirillum itersonii]
MTELIQTTAVVSTASAGRYLSQLCKHFAHKITVEHDETSGRAEFLWGTCTLSADSNALALQITADTQEGLDRIKAVVEDHLIRFGWRETLTVTWTR